MPYFYHLILVKKGYLFLSLYKWLRAQARKEVIEMETKVKEKLKGNGLFGMIKNVEVLYQRVTKKISTKASGVAIASSTPYETSEAHNAHMLEVEFRRSQALEEACCQNLRPR
jgi:hypothetical protein